MRLRAVMIIGTVLLAGAAASGADDGAALYKKCAGCHGASGEGKPAMKAPALKGTALSEDQITERLTKGVPTANGLHKKPIAGLTEPQAKAVAAYIKTL